MERWPHDDTDSLVAFYGDPRKPEFTDEQLVYITPPWRMVLSWSVKKPLPKFLIHRKCAASLTGILAAIWAKYQTQEAIEKDSLHLWGGTYNFRNVRGSNRLSCHAFGAAIDLAPDQNPMNYLHKSNMPGPVVAAFEADGWFWGADFKTRQDPQHFQAAHE